tara:strand:- start:789 stop:1271 length:483 start_codon:yes stop_codon:yes gene_type:complete
MTSILKTDKIEGVTASGTVQMPAGHVVQVVNTSSTAQISTTSNSDTDTGITLDITPKFSTSKLWFLFSGRLYVSAVATEYFVRIKTSDNTTLGGGATLYNGSNGDTMAETCNIQCFHSPNSTSAQTYKITHRVTSATGYIMVNTHPNDVGMNFVIVEIAQ